MIPEVGAHGDEGFRQSCQSALPGRKRAEPAAAPAYAWAEAFHALRGEPTGAREELEADRERIVCLERIIAILIEKNERMRQLLMSGKE